MRVLAERSVPQPHQQKQQQQEDEEEEEEEEEQLQQKSQQQQQQPRREEEAETTSSRLQAKAPTSAAAPARPQANNVPAKSPEAAVVANSNDASRATAQVGLKAGKFTQLGSNFNILVWVEKVHDL